MEKKIGQFKCIVCGNIHFKKIYDNTLLRCSVCGFITANLEICETDLQKIYSANYFYGEEYSDYVADKNIIQKNFSKRLRYIKKKRTDADIYEILEIGCAFGFFGEIIQKQLPKAKYTGIDISGEAVEYGKTKLNLNALNIDYLRFHSENTYTDVFMWDVIEHLPYPEKAIEKISAETIQGSGIYITTGDTGSVLARIRKQKWRMIHPPSHLHYFTKNTITLLLKKYGFRVESITYPAVSRSVKQVFYSLFILNKTERPFITKIYNSIPDNWYFYVNTFDIMFVIAIKL